MKRWYSWAGAAAAILSSALLAGIGPGSGPTERDIALSGWHGGSSGSYDFDIKATSVRGLYPGARKPIELTFVNPYPFALRVTSIEGRLVDASRRGCRPTSSNLIVGQFDGKLPLTLQAGSRTKVGRIPLRMPNTVADACQRTTFTIRIAGRATKVSR
ncbi:hypothetical protein JIG36_44030 [Actinoplanes sp. LDG1-06]|uniref:Uncharacterized protein n=1 Tax=Paractinoplanes ovalisporus TaxID=2810368 RepID=A0ABS2ASZ1_9ACTN|nr:hypothetical protein [Actinoplanes ovalisporus]MBM2622493.1 hypothetical protein [Actinoplanes ovalisporus]